KYRPGNRLSAAKSLHHARHHGSVNDADDRASAEIRDAETGPRHPTQYRGMKHGLCDAHGGRLDLDEQIGAADVGMQIETLALRAEHRRELRLDRRLVKRITEIDFNSPIFRPGHARSGIGDKCTKILDRLGDLPLQVAMMARLM